MININPTTPQLTLIKNLFDAYCSLDINRVTPFISKNYTLQMFPKIHDLPDEMKEGHFERLGGMVTLLNRIEINCHEAIEAPGKVALHASGVAYTVDGTELEYESFSILTIAEEDGQLKVAGFKDFTDPEKREKLLGWFAKVLGKETPQAA